MRTLLIVSLLSFPCLAFEPDGLTDEINAAVISPCYLDAYKRRYGGLDTYTRLHGPRLAPLKAIENVKAQIGPNVTQALVMDLHRQILPEWDYSERRKFYELNLVLCSEVMERNFK